MRGVIVDEHGLQVRDDLEVRDPGAGEVVVRISAAGVCHSDSKVLTGATVYPRPVVLGHEGAGIVDAVGDGVDDVAVGDRVVLHALRSCGQCRACLAGAPTRCRGGFGAIGAPFRIGTRPVHQFANTSVFVERTVVHASQVVAVDVAVPMEAAALLGCGVLTGTGAVFNRARVGVGDSVVVIGIGGVGLNALQGARLRGASSILAIDTNPAKAALASRFGATAFVDGSVAVREQVLEIVPGGVDHVVICIGVAALVPLGVELLGPGGQVVIVGFPGGGERASFDMATLYQDKSILACRFGSSNPARDIPMLADLYLEGRLMLDELITGTLPLERTSEAFDALHQGRADARTILRVPA